MKRQSAILASAVAALLPVAAMAETPGYYGTLHGGYNIARDTGFSTGLGTVDTEFKGGYAVGGALGYDMGRVWDLGGVRFEGEVMYRRNGVDVHKLGGDSLSGSDGNVNSLSGMVNVLHDFYLDGPLTPYFGGGIGVARVRYDDFGVDAIPVVLDDSDTVFAFQGIVGASYDINPGLAITADYRFFGTESPDVRVSDAAGGLETSPRYHNHSLMAGVRLRF